MRSFAVMLALVVVGCSGRDAADANARGMECYKRGAFPCAVTEFSVAVQADPESARYRFNLALALGRSGMHDQAIAELQEVIRLDPTHQEARKTLSRAQTALREAEAAVLVDRLQRPAYY